VTVAGELLEHVIWALKILIRALLESSEVELLHILSGTLNPGQTFQRTLHVMVCSFPTINYATIIVTFAAAWNCALQTRRSPYVRLTARALISEVYFRIGARKWIGQMRQSHY